MVLQRLFDIILTLAKSSLALRGHREDLSQEGYHGNFLSVVQLVARYDSILRQVLDLPKGATRYLSPKIQNEMIECLGMTLEDHLLEKIRASPFFSVIMDTAQDISKVDQLSIIVRYAVITRSENREPVDTEIREVFLGLYAVTKHGAADLVNQVTELFAEKSIDMKKCVGPGYDGASVMSGMYNGVQKRIKDIQPNAEYVHCASHNLNLVINDSVSGCVEVHNFFSTIQEMYTFFGGSIKRCDLLSQFTGESEITLKKLNPTRWSSRVNTISAVKLRFFDIIKALSEIALKSRDKDERNDANSIKTKMLDFEFVFLCKFMHHDLNEANKALVEIEKKLKIYRNDFDLFKYKMKKLYYKSVTNFKINIPV
ncbi:uncharacterized protein LOC106642184 [Copidosoma floridanum]|uniref:uncharacterized protein LOC106642184 n=1 Tax=Copidosoma floridanum TaxID=29053 RepID=UPI000C6FC0D5|nr:uncharacterized protein LOC106642184 [Copidosoma floridanum]